MLQQHAHDLAVDGQGQPFIIKDPLNNITTFTYELGDLISVKDPLNRETKRMLDAAGRSRSIINPLGQKTVYTPVRLAETGYGCARGSTEVARV